LDEKFCDQCGAPLRTIAKFCNNCGADISLMDIQQGKNIPAGMQDAKKVFRDEHEHSKQSAESRQGPEPEAFSPGPDRVNKSQLLGKLAGKKFSKKNLILIFSIAGSALIAIIILLSVFITRSCSNSNITSYSTDAAISGTAYFDAMAPGLAELVSSDQLAILSVDGPPQAYTIYIDPATGSVIEQWSYFILGREINFMDGVYKGGMEVPLSESASGLPVPQLTVYPWEILNNFSAEAVVSKTGTALFNTSALVLPGWNDNFEVARLWLLSGGGNMVTVDSSLAMLNIDPGKALDLDQFAIDDFLVGTLKGDNNRLGAILSPSSNAASYRLSLSPRGQGSTEDGTGFIFDLEGPGIEKKFVIGNDSAVRISGIDGSENSAGEAIGTVDMKKNGNGYDIFINAVINGQDIFLEGFMGSAVWRSNDNSTVKAISNATALIVNPEDEIPAEIVENTVKETAEPSETEWVPVWTETFESNENGWPVSYGEQGKSAYFQSDIFEGQYLVYGQQKKEGNTIIKRLIPLDLEMVFMASIEVVQEGSEFSGGGLILSDKYEDNEIYFIVSATNGIFRLIQKDSNGYSYPLDYRVSSINPPGQVNILSVKRFGPLFYFYINSELVGGLEVENLVIDNIGVGLITYWEEEPITCYFDNLEIYEIQ
jgi:hypothetical protein